MSDAIPDAGTAAGSIQAISHGKSASDQHLLPQQVQGVILSDNFAD